MVKIQFLVLSLFSLSVYAQLDLKVDTKSEVCSKKVQKKDIDYCVWFAELIVNVNGKNNEESILYWKNSQNEYCYDMRSCNRAGWIEWNLENYDKALSFYQKALKYFDKLEKETKTSEKNNRYAPLIANNMALVFKQKGHRNRAFKIFKSTCDKDERYGCLNTAIMYAEDGHQDEALEYFKKALTAGYDREEYTWLRKSPKAAPLRAIDGFSDLIVD